MSDDGSPAGEDGLREIRETRIGGVTTLWTDAPAPVMASLKFRVGRGDETFATGGLTHLVEHLALFPLGRRSYRYNGFVTESFCVFYAEGTAQEAFGFVSDVAASLRDLDLERLATEQSILRTEWNGKNPNVFERLYDLRYGLSGPGLTNYYEWGLDALGATAIQAWAEENFTSENAVLWATAEPPGDLALALPSGTRREPPRPVPRPGIELPLHVEEGSGVLAASATAARSSAINAAFSIASERLHQQLRREEGVTYGTGGGYDPIDPETAHVVLSADCQNRDAGKAQDHLLAILADISEGGATVEELAWDRDQTHRSISDPQGAPSRLDAAARDRLLGAPSLSADELIAERESLTPESIGEAMAAALETLIVLSPAPVPASNPLGNFAQLDSLRSPPVKGTERGPTAQWAKWGEKSRLVLASDGISRVESSSSSTVRYEDCVGRLLGVSGTITVVASTGEAVGIPAGMYEGGDEIAAEVEAAVSDHLKVPLNPTEAELREIVEAELPKYVIGLVPRELDVLAPFLSSDERVIHLAFCTRGVQAGLLALTDQRLFFMFRGSKIDDLFEAKIEDIVELKVRGVLSKRMVVRTDEAVETLEGFQPTKRVKEIEEALEDLQQQR